MTNASAIGLAWVLVFEDETEMLVRFGDFFGSMSETIKYMEKKHGPLAYTIEPSLSARQYGKVA